MRNNIRESYVKSVNNIRSNFIIQYISRVDKNLQKKRKKRELFVPKRKEKETILCLKSNLLHYLLPVVCFSPFLESKPEV